MANKNQTQITTAIILLEIMHHIPRKGKISTSEIHQRLLDAGHKLSLRAVQRYLKQLTEHFDVVCDDSSKPYGYHWLPCADSLNLTKLTAQESLLLTLAEQQLQNLLPSKVMNNLAGFFSQARKNLDIYNPDIAQNKLEYEWLNKIRVVSTTQPLLPPEITDEVFDNVSNALYANKWLDVTYQNYQGKNKNYRVMPLGLAQQGERLYLVCRFDGYQDARSLALHRIQSAQISTHSFDYPTDFSLQNYDNEGRFLFGSGQKVKLSLCISKDVGGYLYETRLSQDQVITEYDDHLHITATVVDSQALDWWLAHYGDKVWSIEKVGVD